ncbi:MAG: discoidin domain-containing protein [Bacteroidaceae bacterium]|nr:discoidin domain-containing protein [Bacteroidaceae bacterium]
MKTKRLFLCLLFLVLGTTAWADKYYQPGSYKGNTTPRLTLEQAVGAKFMIYNTALNGNNDDRTGFLRNNGVQFELDKSKERDFFVYNETFVYTLEAYDDNADGVNDWYAIKSVNTGLYVNAAGKTDIGSAADAKLIITSWDNATSGKSTVKLESWKYNVVENGQITSGGHGSTVFIVKDYNVVDRPYWNGTSNGFDTWDDGHPFAFYIANEFTSEESYLQDLHIYSRCDIYSAQVIYGLVQSPSQITTNHPYDEGEIANLLDGDGVSYHVSDWRENNADDYHYYQVDLGKDVESLYLYMQRRADGKNAPTKYELQVCDTPDGQFVTVGGERETNLANSNVYASDKIELGGSYRYIRIVAKERTVKEDGNFMCMGLSELYVLPGTTAIKDAIDYIAMATTDPVYTRATAKVYKDLVERYNTECPDAKLLSGVPIPGNKYRIYADAFDVENGVYVNREIKADNGLLIKGQGSYNAESDDSEKNKYEWYCEQTSDGYLVFRNVADPTKYLANGAVADEPYKWSMSTLGTQRFGVPLKNIAQQYLAVENNGGLWMGNVRDVQNQTVAPAYVDHDNNADTAPEEVASGLCTDFVFIPVPLEGEEKKITIIGNELVKRNTKLLFDSNGDGTAEVHSLPFSRMFVNATKFSTMRMQLLCNDIHVYQGIRLNDEEGLNTTIATLNGDELSFDFNAVNDGDILDIQLQIEPPFEVMSSVLDVTETPSLYLIRNKHQQGLAQQARPNRASIDIGGDGPISSQTGKRFYAKFNQRGADMDLVEGYEDWTAIEFDATSLFYFTETEDSSVDEYYSVNIHNATTVMKCADHAEWNNNGNTWFVQPKKISNNFGYNIGRHLLDATNNPTDVWGCNHEDGNKIVMSRIDTNGTEVRIRANDDGTAWEFIKVDDDTAKKMLKEFIDHVAQGLNDTLDAKATQEGIDTTKVKYYRFIINTMTERAAAYYKGTIYTPGEDATAKLLQFAQNIHMVEHEIQYALYELPELSDDVVGVSSTLKTYDQPHWYYIRNVNGVVDGNDSYAAFNGGSNPMALQQYAASADKKLANMFYLVGEKNSYAPVMDSDPDNNGLYHDFPGNNLIVDEYLKVHVHNFLAKDITLVSKNVQLDSIKDYFPGQGQQTVMSNLSLKGDEDWSIELEYDLAGNTSFNAYGSCLLASSGEPLSDSYVGGFQVYLKDDRSLVIKCNNADDRYRFWHTQDYFSHIKVVITYSQKKVTLDVYNSLGEKETMTITNVTLNDIDKLSSALPSTGATISSLKTYQVEAMTWKTHEEVDGDANKDDWYILPSSNANKVGLAIVLGEPNDTKMGWTNGEGGNTYISTDLGTADNSTWKFERVTDFDAHIEELIKTYNFEDCVIYDKELAKLSAIINEKATFITAGENQDGEEAAFNEAYYAFLNYTGSMPEELKAPKPGNLYTIRPFDDMETDNSLLVFVDKSDANYSTKEVYNADAIRDDRSYDTRAVWKFEGTANGDYLELTGLKAKNIHTQCYLTALGADASAVNETDAASIALSPLGGCTTMFQVGDKYMAMNGAKVTNAGDDKTKWIVEEIKNPEESVYYETNTSSYGHATLMLGFATTISDDVVAFHGVDDGVVLSSRYIKLTSYDGVLPAMAPVILRNADESNDTKTVRFYYTASDAQKEADNYIYGSLYYTIVDCSSFDDIDGDGNADRDIDVYMLNSSGTAAKMYRTYENYNAEGEKEVINGSTNHFQGGHIPCKANKAFMILSKEESASKSSFSLRYEEGATTDIEFVGTEGDVLEVIETIYDLQGRKLDNITSPGIYIINGKKVFVK